MPDDNGAQNRDYEALGCAGMKRMEIPLFNRTIKEIYSYCHSLLIPKTLENRSTWSIIIQTFHVQYLIPSSRGHDISCLYCVVAQPGLPKFRHRRKLQHRLHSHVSE